MEDRGAAEGEVQEKEQSPGKVRHLPQDKESSQGPRWVRMTPRRVDQQESHVQTVFAEGVLEAGLRKLSSLAPGHLGQFFVVTFRFNDQE